MDIKKEKHMFAIPTHRKCKKAILSIVEEMRQCNETWDIFLVVLDNSPNTIFEENDKIIEKIRKTINFVIYHISMDEMVHMVEKLANCMKINSSYMMELLIPREIDYGKIYNLLYICAISFSADIIHRRDSDCSLGDIMLGDYPIDMEMKYINKPINHVINKLEIHKKEEYGDDEKICIVGGDYAGNWNLDLHELKQNDPEVVKKILRLSNIPEEDIEIEDSINYTENEYKKPSGKAVLDNTFEFEYNVMPECGNISICEIFKYLPNFIGEYGIGYDYFTYFIAYLYRVPIVFHKNKIYHIHDEERYDLIKIEKYWIGMYKNIMLDTIYTELIKMGTIEHLCKKSKGLEALRKSSENELGNLLREAIQNIDVQKEKKIIDTICNDILLYSPLDKYKSVGKIIRKRKREIIENTRRDFEHSIQLIEIWKDIVLNVKKINFWNIREL